MINHLEAPFNKEEVYTTMKQLKSNISNLILNILNNQESPKRYNNTFISLIPKIKYPSKPTDYRPISICNVILNFSPKL